MLVFVVNPSHWRNSGAEVSPRSREAEGDGRLDLAIRFPPLLRRELLSKEQSPQYSKKLDFGQGAFLRYHPPMAGKLVLIIGPSGVGKSVILKRLRAAHPDFHFPRSATTRAKRAGESADLYHFVTQSNESPPQADIQATFFPEQRPYAKNQDPYKPF